MMRDGSGDVSYEVSDAPAERSDTLRPGEPLRSQMPHPLLPAMGSRQLLLWRDYATWAAYTLLAFGVALRLFPLTAAQTDYDEGVYWQSLRAMAHGHPLFTSVFSSQPPVYLYAVYPFYLALGQTLAAARAGIVVYSLIGIVAAYVIGRTAVGHYAGLLAAVLLALDPLYLQESRTLQAEALALGLALAGLALAMVAWRSDGPRRHWLALAAGVVVALGIGAKLFDVVVVIPAALYLGAPLGAAFVDAQGRLVRPDVSRLRSGLRDTLPDEALLLAGLLLGMLFWIGPFLGAWPAFYDQVVRFHLVAGRDYAAGLAANVTQIEQTTILVPVELLGVTAAIAALWRRYWVALPLLLWAGASLVVLLDQHPLFAHHLTLLAPPLALLVAVVAACLWEDAARATASRQVRVSTALVLAALVTFALVAGAGQARHAHGPSTRQLAIAQVTAAATQPGDEVISDDQYVVGLADRDTPPPLVDTSLVRVETGYLTLSQLQQAAQDPNVRAILFASGRLDKVHGFKTWVSEHFKKVADFGGGIVLYVKAPRQPVAA